MSSWLDHGTIKVESITDDSVRFSLESSILYCSWKLQNMNGFNCNFCSGLEMSQLELFVTEDNEIINEGVFITAWIQLSVF